MRYIYRGVTVESDRKLDSTLFQPETAKAEKPTAEAEKPVKKPAKKPARK